MPNFEVYKRTDSRRRAPAVTVLRRGQISFNPAAMLALGNPAAVTFLVEKDECLLGFRATEVVEGEGRRKATGAGVVVRPPGATVAAVPVLRYLGADLSASRRYPLVLLDGVHCIDLKQPGTVVTSNRRKN